MLESLQICLSKHNNAQYLSRLSSAISSLKYALLDPHILKSAFWAAAPKRTNFCRTQGIFVCLFVYPFVHLSSQILLGLKSALLDSRPERANLKLERADFRPERANFKPERAFGDGWTNKE